MKKKETDMTVSTSSYIKFAKKITSGTDKLICIPHAGGGASSYINWQNVFGEKIELLPIQLPGREDRAGEIPLRTAEEAAGKIADEVIPLIEGCRFCIFGHSMGGLIAFELAHQLEKRGYEPSCCFISATSIEEYIESEKSRYLSEEAFIERVKEYEALSSELLEYPEIMELYMRILRADFDIAEDYVPNDKRISCPVMAICGKDDPSENIENMHSWENYTSSGVEYAEFEGAHFYLDEHISEIAGLVYEKMP